MKAIIIAAGEGKRMRPLTDSIPKCMLDFNGKTLLSIHFELLRENKITDIAVISGYLSERINLPGCKYYNNDRYEYNNILNSLMYAEDELNDDVIVTYSDVYYKREVLEKLIASPFDISIIGDLDWRSAYIGRNAHPISEAESIELIGDKVVKIGKKIQKDNAQAEFMGMMKLSKMGSVIFKEAFHSSREQFWGKPFHEAGIFEKAYLTDMLQELVDRKIDLHCLTVKGGCLEIDTLQDYENAKRMLVEI